MKCVRLVWLMGLLSLAGCVHGYKPDDTLMKGDEPIVPAEFKKGTATLKQVKAWSASELSDVVARPSLEIIEKDLNQDGTNDLLVAEEANAGTGGNTYLAFEATSRGYRYIGHLGFGAIRVLPKDDPHRQKILTWWHLSAGEGGVTLVILDSSGFHEITNVTVYAGDQGTAEGNRIADEFFGTNDVPAAELNKIFGTRF
jgi:hypothetical protein